MRGIKMARGTAKFQDKLPLPKDENFGKECILYYYHLRSVHRGESASERRKYVEHRFNNRIDEIKRRKDKLFYVAMVSVLISLSLAGLGSGIGAFGVIAMWIVGYNQGKYTYLEGNERYAYETQVKRWEDEGMPTDTYEEK